MDHFGESVSWVSSHIYINYMHAYDYVEFWLCQLVTHLLKMCVAAAQHTHHMHASVAFAVDLSDQLGPTCQKKRYLGNNRFHSE